jgi:hypothetical protein
VSPGRTQHSKEIGYGAHQTLTVVRHYADAIAAGDFTALDGDQRGCPPASMGTKTPFVTAAELAL